MIKVGKIRLQDKEYKLLLLFYFEVTKHNQWTDR